MGDSVTGTLTGNYFATLQNVLVGFPASPKALDTVISGLDFQNGNSALQRGAVFGLVVGVSFGTTDNSNKATMTTFTVES